MAHTSQNDRSQHHDSITVTAFHQQTKATKKTREGTPRLVIRLPCMIEFSELSGRVRGQIEHTDTEYIY